MDLLINSPEKCINTTIKLPASKSISNRLLLLNALSYSPYKIKNLSESDDTKVMLDVLNSNTTTFDVGAAGTSMRFLTAFLSKIVGEWILTGSERMKNRPIKVLVDALNQLGAKIEYIEKEGYPPLRIYGSALKGVDLVLPGDISSQYISALLMIAPEIENGLSIELSGDIISKPYINLTLELMAEYGVKGFWKGNRIVVPEAKYKAKPMAVEADWSAASYWFEIAALNPDIEVVLQGLSRYSLQGDAQVMEIFKKLRVQSGFSQKGLTITCRKEKPNHFKYNFINQPDLAQTVAVTCCLLKVPFKFSGLQTLKIKETDRIDALIRELAKLGYLLTTNNVDTLEWNGAVKEVSKSEPITIDTYKDHRMAMAFAPVVSCFGSVLIKDSAVVSKSYPAFWHDLAKVGYVVTEK